MCQSCHRGLTRRQLLRGIAMTGAVAATGMAPWRARRAVASDHEQVVLTTMVAGLGTYTYLPLDVPAGVNHLHVKMETSNDQASLGLGIFDPRGPGYQSPGFRGVYGAERREFELAADRASTSFLPGPIDPGTWTVMVPVFEAPVPTEVTITATMRFGAEAAGVSLLGSVPGVVRSSPGWYRGDLHCHTPESSDAWASGTALDVPAWADECRRIGLDFAAMTDHNVITQNLDLGAAAGHDVLLLAGEEMTNWFHGHATVSGLADPTAWIDWRQRPAGVPLQEHEERIGAFLRAAHEQDAFVSAAHPFFANLSWQFFADAAADPEARTDGIEIWTGQWTPDCEVGLRTWDTMLQAGQRVVANGGSDLHGVENEFGFAAGTPTTVVHAEALATEELVAALRAGRSFVTRVPDGVELYLTASGPGEQRQILGGTVYGEVGETTEVEVLVRRAAGMALLVSVSGVPVHGTVITGDEETVRLPVPITDGGYVRAEVRREPNLVLPEFTPSDGGMEAFTNPIFLATGEPPEGHRPVDETPPPGHDDADDDRPGRPQDPGRPDDPGRPQDPGPPEDGRRPEQSGGPAAGGTGGDTPRVRPATDSRAELPATGGAGAALGGLAALGGAAALHRTGRTSEDADTDADGGPSERDADR